MDVNELQVGSTLYFQVFQKGGLIWTGGFSLLAGERRSEPDRPGMFFDEDLNEAMKIAVREAVNFPAEQKIVPMSREEAYSLTRPLPRLPGSGYPRGRALHDSQVDFHKEVTIPPLIASEEIRFGPCLGTAN